MAIRYHKNKRVSGGWLADEDLEVVFYRLTVYGKRGVVEYRIDLDSREAFGFAMHMNETFMQLLRTYGAKDYDELLIKLRQERSRRKLRAVGKRKMVGA